MHPKPEQHDGGLLTTSQHTRQSSGIQNLEHMQGRLFSLKMSRVVEALREQRE